jgi:type VII secretion-associated serine protease mycosin
MIRSQASRRGQMIRSQASRRGQMIRSQASRRGQMIRSQASRMGGGAAAIAVAACLACPSLSVAAYAGPANAAKQVVPCGPTFTDQLSETPWPMKRLRPEAAWPLSRGQGVTVAVIDSGVSTTHNKLTGQVLKGADFVDQGGLGDCDNAGHGTLVAGIIAGKDSPESPFHGIAPGAKILPIKVLPDTKKSDDPTLPKRIADAIVWAVGHNATVINLSLTTADTPELAAAVQFAASKKIVLVAASGNEGDSPRAGLKVYPAAYDDVIAVAGIDENGAHVSASSAGDYVDVAAPGLGVPGPSTQGNGYALDPKGGTSFAAAFVSGVAALVRARDPKLSAKEVARRLTMTADPPPDGHNPQVGAGVVNPYRAVASILDNVDTNVPRITGQAPALTPPDGWSERLQTIAITAALVGGLVAFLLQVVWPLVRRALRAASTSSPAATPQRGAAPSASSAPSTSAAPSAPSARAAPSAPAAPSARAAPSVQAAPEPELGSVTISAPVVHRPGASGEVPGQLTHAGRRPLDR